MFSLKNRLKSQKDIEEIFKAGKNFFGEKLSFRFKKTDRGFLRVGFSIGLKFSKKAIERNRLKRQLREVVREIFLVLPENKKIGLDIVIMTQKKIKSSIKKEDIKRDMDDFFEKYLKI